MSERSGIERGMKGFAEKSVVQGNTAVSTGSGEIEVFATPAMIALMEEAAVQCLKGRLAPEETSVGVKMTVSHVAATPVGMRVRAEATVEEADGRRISFTVAAFDDREKIGEGTHERVVIQRERFMSKVNGKLRQS